MTAQAATRAVVFPNRDGLRLFGIVHEPEPDRRLRGDVGIILLSPGVKMRVAPHRLYNDMARRFTDLGFTVLRFDFYGLGDSEGELDEEYLADVYGAIQVGRYVGDTIAAMDWMERECKVSRFVLSGLCGGAITGLLTGAKDPRVACLLGLAIPVILDGSNIDFWRYMTDAQLKGARDGYLRKLCDPASWQSWVRFLTFQSHYSLIFKSLLRPLLKRSEKLDGLKKSEAIPKDNTNGHFQGAFTQMVSSGRRVLLLFAGADRLYSEFDVKFLQRNKHLVDAYSDYFEMSVVKESNHIFSFPEWEEEMLAVCSGWLSRYYSVERPRMPSDATALR